MAGRPKRGIAYAAWDVDIFENDTKIDELLDAQGWTGFAIYFYLFSVTNLISYAATFYNTRNL